MTKNLSDEEDLGYYLDPLVRKQLEKSRKAVLEGDQDRVFVITGFEGSGKTVLAMQLGYFFDKDLSLDDICFSPKEFEDRITTKKKNGVVILDEGFRGLGSRAAISKENKNLIRLLQECRQRNLFIFICIPSIFLLEKYVGIFRSHGLFHTSIYKKDFKKRFYKVFNRQNKKLLYILGYKLMSYSKPKIALKHRFYGKYPSTISEKEYRKKKLDAFKDKDNRESGEDKYKIQRDVLIYRIFTETKFKSKAVSKWLEESGCPLKPSYLINITLEYRKNHKISSQL
ncbi:hypothetical protein LCGC14_0438980 [marine sediment metagenome]|uniref:Novel STAND NTPase 3 domain-containing protein n=1 Tax=marine sediment metagenome TaxID=412755 RepID=A0A0F9SKU5_9ZZZZ